MKIGTNGLNLIKEFEGFSAKPYLCPAGIMTIGYGTTYYEDGKKVSKNDDWITKERAEQILRYQVNNIYASAVNRYVQVPITQNQFDALVSFAYNLGNGALRSSTLLKKINSNDMVGASNEFVKWNRAGGKVLAGLTKRRLKEKELFLKD